MAESVNTDNSPLYSQNMGQTRHQEIKSLRTASQPRFVASLQPDFQAPETIILFSYAATSANLGPSFHTSNRGVQDLRSKVVRHVAMAFAHENYRILHTMTKTVNNFTDGTESTVYFLYYTLARKTQQELTASGSPLEYRYVIDGIWTHDPANKNTLRKINGSLVSQIAIERAPSLATISPEIVNIHQTPQRTASTAAEMARQASIGSRSGKKVILRYVGPAGSEIFAAGTFNHFDPYMHQLLDAGSYPRDASLRVFELELKLLPGTYYYHYLSFGETQLDALNLSRGSNSEGRLYSLLNVPQ